MIFADASALIAIITGEAEAESLTEALEADGDRLCSAVVAWETVAGLCRSYAFTVPEAQAQLDRFLAAGGFRHVPIGVREQGLALEAYARFGKGRHPAGLNMGDCFAYACAKANGARLLYKGGDFAGTDLG